MKKIFILALAFKPAILLALLTLSLVLPLQAKEGSSMLRIVCAALPEGHEKYVVATQNKRGKLRKVESLKLHASLITPWLEVPKEELHLCVREDNALVSKCSFTFPEGAQSALLVLLPGEAPEDITAQVIDPKKHSFGKGDVLISNSSSLVGQVKLGKIEVEAKPSEILVQKPGLDDKGMYHMLVSYTDESDEKIICSDNFLQGNKTGRNLLIITPDPHLGLKVFNITEFEPFE